MERYILKAIHNKQLRIALDQAAVISIGKIHFESNSQPSGSQGGVFLAVISIGKIHFESNSQRRERDLQAVISCDFHWKDTF